MIFRGIVREMLDEETDRDRFSSRPGFNSEESVSGSGDAELLDYRIVVDGVEFWKRTPSLLARLDLLVCPGHLQGLGCGIRIWLFVAPRRRRLHLWNEFDNAAG